MKCPLSHARWPVHLNEREVNCDTYSRLQKVFLVHRHLSIYVDTLHFHLVLKYRLAMIDPFSVWDCDCSIYILVE